MFDTLKFIPRLSTKRISMEYKETVSTHIFEMQYLTYLIYHSSKSPEIRGLSLVSVYEMILLHEMDEVFSNDLPHSFKQAMRDKGHSSALESLKEVALDLVLDQIPEEIRKSDRQEFVLDSILGGTKTPESEFVKFCDYINLYLNCVKLNHLGYNLEKTISNCIRLTKEHRFYNECPLVQTMIEQPELFTDKEFN